MVKNVRKFWIHDFVKISEAVLSQVNPTPRGTNDDSICFERLYFKEIGTKVTERFRFFFIDFEIIFEHFDFDFINVIDDILLKLVGEVNCYPANATKRLEYLLNFCLFQPLPQMVGNRLRDN